MNTHRLIVGLTALLLMLLPMGGAYALAINTAEDIDTTIHNLYDELALDRKIADEEIDMLEESRAAYQERIVKFQQESDKAALVLAAQDGGSLFCVGMASEALSNICNSFEKEKVPFENWLQTMASLSSRYTNIRKALSQVHTENLAPQTRTCLRRSAAICDTLEARFAALRDSIALDRSRYERLAAEIRGLEAINREVVDRIRSEIFRNNNEGFATAFSSFDYSGLDFFYETNREEAAPGADKAPTRMRSWERGISLAALAASLALVLALRYLLPKKSPFRSKRWFYALLLFMAVCTAGLYLMSWSIGLNNYMRHIVSVCNDSYIFMFWMVLAATLRLKRPGLGWSVAAYAPLFCMDTMLLQLATTLTRTQALKFTMSTLCIFFSLAALVILAIGARRFLKQDYPAVFGCIGLIFLATGLVLAGYYYPAFILVLFSVSVMTYLAFFACFKHLFARRLERCGPILHLTLSHLVYPLFFIFAIMQSLDEAANVFNLRPWLSEQLQRPFVDLPQFGIISASRIILLIVAGIAVNYLIKLVKQLLMRIDRKKYETGGHAVAITLCTMLTWFVYGIVALAVLQINHGGVLAAIGGASLGIGFAMKETFENLISGLQLMASRARPGDLVVCDGLRGVIKHIGILSTQIEIEDGPMVSFPNRQLLGSTFTNLTINHRREIRHIIFDIDADSDIELAKQLMLDAGRDIDGVVDHDSHYVVMRNSNSGIVRLDYKCWIDSARYLRTEPAVREAIFKAFREHGIKIADIGNELGMHVTASVME